MHEEKAPRKEKAQIATVFLVTVLVLCFLSATNIKSALSQPTVEESSTMWTLTNENLELVVNKTRGWVNSFSYGTLDLLPSNMGIGGDVWQCRFDKPSGSPTWDNYLTIEENSTSYNDDYAELILNLTSTTKADTWTEYTYRLYEDHLNVKQTVFYNFSTTGNFSSRNLVGTYYPDWSSILVFGGFTAFNDVTQFNSTSLGAARSYNWNFEYLEQNNTFGRWARPMCYPLAVFVRPDLAMALYSTDFYNESIYVFNPAATVYRTEFGASLEINTIPFNITYTRSWNFDFIELDSETCWTQIVQNYFSNLTDTLDITDLAGTYREELHKGNQIDIWPSQWDNATFMQVCKNFSINSVWLYGWQAQNETYPISGAWTTLADSVSVNATYVTNVIRNWQANGFKVYMYMRDAFDYNISAAYSDWFAWKNKDTLFWLWSLAGSHKAVRMEFSNSTFREWYLSLAQNISTAYSPNGLAMDIGTGGAALSDYRDYYSGSHYIGTFEFIKSLAQTGTDFLINGLPQLQSFMAEGSLYESPGYNKFTQLEYLVSHLYPNTAAWMLTTSAKTSDQTPDKEIALTKLALASGIQRAFDYSAASLNNVTLQTFVTENYQIYWSQLYNLKPVFLTLYPINNNFFINATGNVAVYLKPTYSDDTLWIIAFNNGTTGIKTFQLYQAITSEKVGSLYIPNYWDFGLSGDTSFTETITDLSLYDFHIQYSTAFLPFGFILGMVGLGSMMGGSMWCIHQIKKGEYNEAITVGFLIALVGFALVIAWLWG